MPAQCSSRDDTDDCHDVLAGVFAATEGPHDLSCGDDHLGNGFDDLVKNDFHESLDKPQDTLVQPLAKAL
jgi:hypothetical protein